MDATKAQEFVDKQWEDTILPTLTDYIRIPNKSPLFDPKWHEHGYMDQAVELLKTWAEQEGVAEMELEVVRLKGRTPLIFIEIPGESEETVVLYGHLDKQPEMSGWRPELGPWKPVRLEDKLYGRGAADDGYALFASLTAVRALREQKTPHARCVIIIEACEESGSFDLPHYIDALADRIGNPDLVVCLDSGCGNYDQLWATTSLRGMASGNLRVEDLTEGVHSGDAGGIVPDTFRIGRLLLSRLEDETSGQILPKAFHCDIPVARLRQAQDAAKVLGDQVYSKFPFLKGARPQGDDLAELVLNRTWRPALTITGADGLPALDNAGNVARPLTAFKVSLRLPPLVNGAKATQALKALLEADPPYGAKVGFEPEQSATGWHAPLMEQWLSDSMEQASQTYFGARACLMGEGGTIPFMAMLGEKFPDAQFLITGLLGPHSNAHGPNEFLHIPTAKRLTACVAQVLKDHYLRSA